MKKRVNTMKGMGILQIIIFLLITIALVYLFMNSSSNLIGDIASSFAGETIT